MADIFGAGLTHYPALIAPDEDKMYPLLRTLKNDERQARLRGMGGDRRFDLQKMLCHVQDIIS